MSLPLNSFEHIKKLLENGLFFSDVHRFFASACIHREWVSHKWRIFGTYSLKGFTDANFQLGIILFTFFRLQFAEKIREQNAVTIGRNCCKRFPKNVSQDCYVAQCEASRRIAFQHILCHFFPAFFKLHLPANNLLKASNLRSCWACWHMRNSKPIRNWNSIWTLSRVSAFSINIRNEGVF